MNGKKLSNLQGLNDEEKLAALCSIIEEEVQKLNPYQPIANSQVLVKLCCRDPGHKKQQILDICSGTSPLSLHSTKYCFHDLNLSPPCAPQTMVCCVRTASTTTITLDAIFDL